ncbi:helix-turn-helix domain-containing protein [Desulfurispirillum indicum]|uniref:Helix-turn-helix domain protein n=1 Tax=Desulfurispirillum indicum (strain ATCC BAA-1389 / DSM 22839 / S5) TaxID=653733 RepID=E6W5C8_DESIS|nr:helix-turn-helix domain-containing protein [Desulfurispirillum indicum]ADU64859.1 helix-turn-helix domain protein [Desulfurispirillum indicum S5]UCZ56790.1 helix-turn-helix domain-containing protein [Desulfurispirillum indicum]
MKETDIHGTPHDATEPETLGSYLKRLREARGITVEEVADRTKIAVSQIAAIENDQHQFLPPKAFVLGFIKAICNEVRGDYEYAKVLLFTMLGEIEPGEAPRESSDPEKKESAKEIINKNSSLSPVIFGAVVVVVVAAIAYFYLSSQPQEPVAAEREQYDVIAEAQRNLQEQQAAEEEARRQEELRQQQAEEARLRAEEEARLQAEREARQREQAAAQQQATQPSTETATENPFAGAFLNDIPLSVRLEGLSEAWVKMVGSHGEAMETTTLREGRSLSIESQGTVIVALGNAGGVNVFIDNKEHGPVGRPGQVRRFLVEPREDDQYRIIQISREQYIAVLRSLGQSP